MILHFVTALVACTIYFAASRKLPFLVRRPWLAGPVYGICVYLCMYLVVVPLSAAPWKFLFTAKEIVLALTAHTLCVGLPIALAARRYAAPSTPRAVGAP